MAAGGGESGYVGRGGLKLAFALDRFGVNPAGLVAADLGCNVGGFTDCLLRRGAARVHAVDTGRGALAWRLRTDPRVVVHERTNALRLTLPEPVALVVIDVAWTRQARVLPAAARMLGAGGIILSLVKPQYEAAPRLLRRGLLDRSRAAEISAAMPALAATLGLAVVDAAESPLTGAGGNVEYWLRVAPAPTAALGCHASATSPQR
ncbi:MAG: TlyA family rRNA (cytidine-2'-O)-methyltransferase [Planctomycetes bacterium]|nr:TlyA family rRNA (cytidine-2'-O)-methyltransferase [Planctomycetota bacterium]